MINHTRALEIVYTPANEYAGGLLPEQSAAFGQAVNDFFCSRDSQLFTGRRFLVLEVPELNAHLNLWRIKAEHGKTVVHVRYSFAPNHEELPGAERFYMAKRECIQNWSR